MTTAAAAPEADSKFTRLTVNIADDVAEMIRRMKRETTAGTATEVVRRAIAVLDFFYEQQKLGNKVLVQTAEGKVKEIVIL